MIINLFGCLPILAVFTFVSNIFQDCWCLPNSFSSARNFNELNKRHGIVWDHTPRKAAMNNGSFSPPCERRDLMIYIMFFSLLDEPIYGCRRIFEFLEILVTGQLKLIRVLAHPCWPMGHHTIFFGSCRINGAVLRTSGDLRHWVITKPRDFLAPVHQLSI